MAELKSFEVIMRMKPQAYKNSDNEVVFMAEPVQKLVRCKDCIHGVPHGKYYRCGIEKEFHTYTSDYFCACGTKGD